MSPENFLCEAKGGDRLPSDVEEGDGRHKGPGELLEVLEMIFCLCGAWIPHPREWRWSFLHHLPHEVSVKKGEKRYEQA